MSNSALKKDIDQEIELSGDVTAQFELEDQSDPSSLSIVRDEITSFDLENALSSDVPELPDTFEETQTVTEDQNEFTIDSKEDSELSISEESAAPAYEPFTPPGLEFDDIPTISEESEDEPVMEDHQSDMPDLPSEPTMLKDMIKDSITKSKIDNTQSQINIEITGLHKLDKLDQLNALNKIDSLSEKLDALHDLNRLLQMHGELFENLAHLNKIDRLTALKKLDRLDELHKLDSIKELENLKHLDNLKSLERVSEIAKLENLVELRALDNLQNLSKLERLEYLKKLDELDQLEGLDKLNNLDQLTKLDNVGFFEKLDKLDKLNIMNKKFHIIFLGQCFGFFLEVVKFGLASVFVLYLLSTNAGQKIATKSLSAVGFGAPAQTNFGLMLLQGEIQEPKFEEIISNIRKKISYDYQRAFSIDNNLTMTERVNIIKDVMDYDYQYNNSNIKDETIKALKQQIVYSKANILPKIEYDIAMAKNSGQMEDEKILKELKVFFINGNYTEIVQKYQYSKSNLESLRLATIVATLELYIEDPQTLRQLIAL